MTPTTLGRAAAVAALLAVPAALWAHLRLIRSEPGANSEVAPTQQVKLWFSQPPSQKVTTITVTDATGAAVAAKPVVVDAKKNTAAVALDPPLAPGRYGVAWRTMAKDGHVMKGEFGFVVTGAARP
jgi:hypothetical protein